MSLRFDDQVVLVTGATRGLGLAFARCLAEAGATVAVNHTQASEAGEAVVAGLVEAGGRAVYCPGRVEAAGALVDDVVARCGRLDAVVHNAGFVRDKTLRKMSEAAWDEVLDVHLKSSFQLTQAAWPHFEAVGGGSVVLLVSVAGMYGNFGQGNYAAAKLGMYGLCRTVALEGAQANIRCNCVAPFGATTLNSGNMTEEMKALIKTDYVAPLVAYLAHPACPSSGGLFEASGGRFKAVRWERSEGLALDTGAPMTMTQIADGWDQLVDFSTADHPTEMREALRTMYEA